MWMEVYGSSHLHIPSYALMVQFEEKNEITEGIRLEDSKLPGWMVTGIIS
jgi:hypothetical protein